MDWYTLLPRVWNMSLTASVLILAVLAARLVLRKAPAVFRYALWGVVLFRLLCPVSIPSPASLFNAVDAPVRSAGIIEYIPQDIVHTEYPAVTIPLVGDAVNSAINESLPQGAEQLGADPLEAPVSLLTWLWLTGVAGMLCYSIVSLLRLRRTMAAAVRLQDNVRMADGIGTAFVMGILRPQIYIPSVLPEKERAYVILHEQRHIRRGDHIFRLLGWGALCLHWFNPLVWLAFRLSERDMEHACDEAVVKRMENADRAAYSAALLHCAADVRRNRLMPAFGESDIRSRVRNVMRGKKPALWLVLTAAVLCAVLAVCGLTDPLKKEEFTVTLVQGSDEMQSSLSAQPEAGQSVFFGTYEQDNDPANGAEPIEWTVAEVRGDHVLLISRFVLEHRPFHEEDENAVWKDCTLRSWLNEDFLTQAFSPQEQEQLLSCSVIGTDNPVTGTKGSPATKDRVFIPSVNEMTRWFATDTQRAALPTAYAAAQGARRGEGAWWWLRTPGGSTANAASVNVDGSVDASGHLVWYPSVGVRPCICVQLQPGAQAQQKSAAEQQEPQQELQQNATSPQPQPTVPVLDTVLAQQTIQQILATLRLTPEHAVSFSVPSLPPRAEDGTELFITLNATFRLADGSYTVQRPVDDETGWMEGDVVGVSLQQEGELTRILLRAAYRIPVGENAWKELAASYVQLNAPFTYNTAPVLEEPTASVEYRDGESLVHVKLQNGDCATLSLTLPEGFVLAENWEKSIDPGMPPAVAVLWQGGAVGTLRLYPFAGDHSEVDPADNELPMPVFAAVALSNHVDYDEYTVIRSTDTGAAATARYLWQQMETFAGAAAALPWNSRDCILAYDWSVLPCYMELQLEEGLLTQQQLRDTADGIRWQKNG
ncbi:MAG: hypothetical protein IJ412_11930 [Oscillospiraceae bacterium]|nr:hypothetical protein [Oscillospiraceae bacterium]